MNTSGGSNKFAFSYEGRSDTEVNKDTQVSPGPTITICRASGVGGYTVASSLAKYLQMHAPCPGGWTVWGKNLVQKVLEDHHLQGHIGDFIREDHKGTVMDSVEEWLGLHPSAWTLVEQTNATMLQLAKMGNVILMGWGAHLVTVELKTAFHVRLEASFEKRLSRVLPGHGFDQKAAIRYIKKEDEGRRRYIKDNFDKRVDDPMQYHMVLNVDRLPHDECARVIGNAVINHFKLARHAGAMGSENRVARM
jgi:cytidylate kinase